MISRISEGLGSTQALPERGNVVRPPSGFFAPAPLRVLLVTEGTYPFHFGGVSTWCHTLVESLPDVRFSLMAFVGDRKLQPRFEIPSNVDEFLPVSMWGTYDLLETKRELSFTELRRRRQATTEAVVQAHFVPAFRSFVDGLLRDELAAMEMARSMVDMYRFFMTYDLDAALRSRAAWETFGDVIGAHAGRFAKSLGMARADYGLLELTRSMQWIYRWLFPLARPIPRVDVVHAAMAGLCTMVAVTAKREHGAGFLLTEHGIYLREAYLAAARSHDGWLLKMLRTSFARRMAELSYAWADQIGPVCDYNHRWELRVGATRDRLRTMYYGVDSTRFQPLAKTSSEPVVTWVGRIDPLKDIHTLLKAAAIVHAARPDVRFRLYGAALPGAEDYHRSCLALQHELGLDHAVTFAGYIGRPMDAFNDSDVVVMSSISEAVPYSILEAMLCAKPVVATAVGGIPEELGGCGVLVEPRNPEQMGAAILDLMNDSARRTDLGRAARDRAMGMFDIENFAADHRRAYRRVAKRPRRRAYAVRRPVAARPALPPADPAGVTKAATAVHQLRTSPPVDSLEVAALMESMGITDSVASARYGAADVFELAGAALEPLRSNAARVAPAREDAEDESTSRWMRLRDLARVPLALAQAGLLLAVIFAFVQLSGWTAGRLIWLGLGMTSGILLVSVLVQALGRRPSIYLGFHDRASAAAAIDLVTAVAAAVVAAIALMVVVAGFLSSPIVPAGLVTFIIGFAALSLIWIAAAGPIIARAGEWLVLALAVGVGVMLGAHYWVSSSSADFTAEAAVALAAGYIVVLAGRRLSLRTRSEDAKGGRAVLPSTGYLLHEAAPYLAYSVLYMAFFVLPHAVGWAGLLASRVNTADGVGTIEHWLTLGLLPLLIATGLAEQAASSFWRRASAVQRTTAGTTPADFGLIVLRSLYLPQLARLLAVLSLACLGTWAAIQTGALGSISGWLRPPEDLQAEVVLVSALMGYALLGWSLFNFTYTLSLARPELAVRDLLPAIGIALAAGIPLSFGVGFGYSVIGFVAGGLTLVLTSSRTSWRLLRSADYHYFAST